MKLVKMSLLAATLIASSAFAIDNVKVSGNASLFYATMDALDSGYNIDPDGAFFRQEDSAGQAALGLGMTADLTEGMSAGVHLTALSSLGLANTLVSNVWEGTPEDEFWFDEAWIAGTVGKTTGKIGRMQLDTPLVFSEMWSIAYNTFEAAVIINEDIPNTTLVAAYVGQSNGGGGTKSGFAGIINDFDGGSANTNFKSFHQGAYAFGAVNNSWAPLTVQAWYYQAQHLLSTYWVEADYASDFGLSLGAIYTGLSETSALSNESNDAFALKAGYEMEKTFAASVAYSQTGSTATALNVGANLDGYGQSKLYTEAWWNYGYITMADTSAFNITASLPEELTWVALDFYYTQSTTTDGMAPGTDLVMKEGTLAVSKSFGPLDSSLAYTYTDADDQNNGDAYGNIQVYLTYNF